MSKEITSSLMFRNWTKRLSFCRTDLIDPDKHLCRPCRNWLTWKTYVSSLSNEIDPDMIMCWLCRLKSTLINLCVDTVGSTHGFIRVDFFSTVSTHDHIRVNFIRKSRPIGLSGWISFDSIDTSSISESISFDRVDTLVYQGQSMST